MQFLLMIRIKTILSVLLEKNRPTSPAAEGSETLKSQNLFVVDLGLWNHDTSAIMLDSDSVDRAIIELCTQFQSIVIELLKLCVGANTFLRSSALSLTYSIYIYLWSSTNPSTIRISIPTFARNVSQMSLLSH